MLADLPIWSVYFRLRDTEGYVNLYAALALKVISRLNRFSDKDQKHYTKLSISPIIRILYAFASSKDSIEIYEAAEKTEMQIALQLLKSKFLDKRVRGINNITEGITRVTMPSSDEFLWFKERSMIEWLKNEKVAETVLTERPHVEILKRSQGVFSFLAERGELNKEDLEKLWESTIDKHESYVRTVYDVVTSLASVLPKTLLDLVYSKLKEIDLLQTPDFVITAMKKFTHNACISLRRQYTDAEAYCLTEFQTVLQRPDVPAPLLSLVKSSIVELLSLDEMSSFRRPVLKSFLDAGGSVQSVSIVLQLLRDLPSDVCRDFLRQQDSNLVQDIVKWVIDTTKQETGAEDLRVYLQFLETVVSKGANVKLKTDDLQVLWNEFTSEECPVTHTSVFFMWLRMCLENSSDFLISSDLAMSLFETYLCTMPASTVERLPLQAYLCFQQFFLYVNTLCQSIRSRDDTVLSRTGEKLYGIETLILFVLHTTDEAVISKGIRLLAQLHTRVLTKDADVGIVAKFVRDRIDALLDLTTSLNPREAAVHTERNLKILTGIIEAYEYIITAKHYYPDYRDWQTAYYRLPEDNSWKPISTSRSESIGTLRRSIAYINNYEAESVKLEYGPNLYTFIEDEKVLGKLGHPLHFTVRYEVHEYYLVSVAEIVGDEERAQVMLFELVSKGDKSYRELVWFILSRITSNKSLQLKIKELGITYTVMMASSSFHKQLFCLLVLHQVAKADSVDDLVRVHKPNDLLRVLENNADSSDQSLLRFFDGQENAHVLQSAQLMLDLIYAFKDGKVLVNREKAIRHILDLLFLYAKNVSEESEMPHPSIPECTWRCIMEYSDKSDLDRLRSSVSDYANLESLMFYSLQQAKNTEFSAQMKDFFKHASENPLNLFARISGVLMHDLPDAIANTTTSREYFSLLSKLIKKQGTGDYRKSYELLFSFLQSRSPEDHSKTEDKGLIGALKLMRAMVTKSPELADRTVAEYVLLTCLIDMSETHELHGTMPKCKSGLARLAGFKLLAALGSDEGVLDYVLSVLKGFQSDLSWRKPKLACWLHSFNPHEKSTTGYVGIRNLGCTCYMNSMLQQLFMIETFRNGLLSCQSPNDPDTPLYQLQKIMVGLKQSDKAYIQVKGLCAAYKNWEGQPINPHEQMDIDEFFNGLMDKVEEGLKETNTPRLVEEHFRGILTHQCIGKGACTHKSERDEPFLVIPLEIKNKRSIIESLEALTVGEVLEGDNAYACDDCNAKVVAKRRLCIRSLPNVLIFSLRRFDFDMDTMNRVKLNSFCEFPMTLNMEPYTIEGVTKRDGGKETEDASPKVEETPGYYQYSLRGIVIHSGYAEAGHYYSLILDHETGKWLEFNDTVVDPFNAYNIPSEAFGAVDKMTSNLSHEEGGKLRNAYILLYERSEKYNVKGRDDVVAAPLPTPAHIPVSESSKELQSKVHASNQKYWRKKRMFSLEYSQFVLSLLRKPSPQVLKFALAHYLTVQIRCKEPTLDLMKNLYERLGQDQDLALWFLEVLSFEPMTKELLFECPLNEVRKYIVGLGEQCFKRLSEDDQKSVLRRLVDMLGKVTNRITSQISSFIELLYRLGLFNPSLASAYKLPSRMLALLLRQPISPIDEVCIPPKNEDIALGRVDEPAVEQFAQPSANQQLNYTFVIAVLNAGMKDGRLSEEEVELLSHPDTISTLIKGVQGKFGANQASSLYLSLISTQPSSDLIFSTYLKSLLRELKNTDYDQFRPILIQAKRLLCASQGNRATQVLTGLGEATVAQFMFIRATETMIGFWYKLVGKNTVARQWFTENVKTFMPLALWKQKYQTWSSQTPGTFHLTKVHSVLSSFTDFHPSPTVVLKLAQLLTCKIPESRLKDYDSDEDLYSTPLQPGSLAEYRLKEDTPIPVEVLACFQTSYYVRCQNPEQDRVFFLPADDERIAPLHTL